MTFGKSAQTYERLWKSCDRISSPQAIGPYFSYYGYLREHNGLEQHQEAFDKFMLEDKPHFEALMATH